MRKICLDAILSLLHWGLLRHNPRERDAKKINLGEMDERFTLIARKSVFAEQATWGKCYWLSGNQCDAAQLFTTRTRVQ